MIDEYLENIVITLHANNGWPIRKISRELSISRSRIRRMLQSNTDLRDKPTEVNIPVKTHRASKLDPYKDFVVSLMEKHPKITAQRVFEHLVEKGYDGGISICRYLVRALRGAGSKEPIKMVEPDPGQLAVHDWSDYNICFTGNEKKEKVTFFSYILGYSRRQYIAVVDHKTQQTLFRSLIAAFIYMDGVPREIRADNQKACVDHWEPGRPVFNRKYLSSLPGTASLQRRFRPGGQWIM